MSDDGHPEHDELHGRLDKMFAKLDAIQEQTTRTNGRTTKLEHIVQGKPGRYLPDGAVDRGLMGQVHDAQPVIAQMRAIVTVAKWLAATFGAAAVGLAGNLLANLL